MADRVLAFHDGRVVGEWLRGEANEKDVMIKAAGSSKEKRA
jgi:ABC-type sugar transport system ATPase subunit